MYLSFFYFQWNGTTTYDFAIERDFGTDYGICCWYTPQLNLTEVYLDQIAQNLTEPHWGEFFTNIQKVSKNSVTQVLILIFQNGGENEIFHSLKMYKMNRYLFRQFWIPEIPPKLKSQGLNCSQD